MEDAGTNCSTAVENIIKDLKAYTYAGFSDMTPVQEVALKNALEQAWLSGRFYMNMTYLSRKDNAAK